ncbi:MAG: hypothetical protein E7513_03230 [Ruminococcaceae bacterium]|nr:hypothetical protein [Oscillospiraceae bacterium]
MKKFKEICKKISDFLSVIFGYGIAAVLFAGGLTFFGYLAAIIIGGPTATAICLFIKDSILPVIIYVSTILVLMGLLIMYLRGETALTPDKKKNSKHEGEM